MITGIGTDAVSISRMEKLSEHTLQKIFHPRELEALLKLGDKKKNEFLASRFAVKEAYAKARGLGFCDIVVPRQICTYNDSNGKPIVILCGETLENAPDCQIFVSITHEEPLAIAFVVLEDNHGEK